MRKGRFDKQEIVYIKQHCDFMSYEKMGVVLKRDPESIEKYIKEKLGKNLSLPEEKAAQASHDLQNRPYWKNIKEQFDKDELEMFLYHWGRMITQFKEDVLPTEELQVIDAIKLELLMNRALKEQQLSSQSIRDNEDLIFKEKKLGVEHQDMDLIFNLERQVAVIRASQETLSKDYKDLQTKKAALLKDLKATRDQRIKRLEDSKETFIGWVKRVMTDDQYRTELGTHMEKMRLAMEKEQANLSEYHTYENNEIDQPFLTPETTKDE